MIECIFTLDYEIYGNGDGKLHDLVYEPTEKLKRIFDDWGMRFVNFVEVAELEKIEQLGTDTAIDRVTKQIRELDRDGFEIGLHLHPQWCNARHENGKWHLDNNEYNLCTLSRTRIQEILAGALAYLRNTLAQPDFTPLAFRAGNWLFQPTSTAAGVLREAGIKIDSSVFKGGRQHNHQLDYRQSLKNGNYWWFSDDTNQPDAMGSWLELPIYSEMVPFWKMRTQKRMSLNKNVMGSAGQDIRKKTKRLLDFLRFRQPLKLDFCRMTLPEMTSMLDKVIATDRTDPESYRPLVAIGHSKDLTDLETVNAFLAFLSSKKIAVVTFADVYSKISNLDGRPHDFSHTRPQDAHHLELRSWLRA